MSAFTRGQAGVAAVEKKNWPEAIDLLSQALAETKSPTWLLARAQAYQNTGEPEKALVDVEQAYHAAAQRGNDKSRKQMIEAQYRRAVLLFKKGRYADSDCCCVWAMQLAEGKPAAMADDVSTNVDENGEYKATLEEARAMKYNNGQGSSLESIMAARSDSGGKDPTGYQTDWNRAYMWRNQALAAMNKLPKGDPGRKVSVTRLPSKQSQADLERDIASANAAKQKAAEAERSRAKIADHAKSEAEKKQTLDAAGKFRNQFYQSDKSITITLLMKFADREEANKVKVQFQPDLVVVSGVPRDPPVAYLQVHAPIDPSKSKFRAAPMKVELELVKAEPAKWPTWGTELLEDPRGPSDITASSAEISTPSENTVSQQAPDVAAKSEKPVPSKPAAGPAYPTSSKSGPKNWDKIDDGEEEDEGQDVNNFFKQLYKNSTPEQQRAMMKSYVESNGTALSTDWNNVKDKKVETVPPDGVEAKKWSS